MTPSPEPHRRLILAAGGAGLLTASRAFADPDTGKAVRAIAAIEARIGGRVGVAAWGLGSSAWVRWRARERFAFCSTFKALLAAAVLARIDAGSLSGDRIIPFTGADLIGHAPRTTARVGEGAMPVYDLCAAAVEVSDNGAANLLLTLIGGPPALTAWLRKVGDPVTRLDRTETALNTNLPGDPRDTTTPEAFVRVLNRLLLGDALSAASRQRLTGWLVACETGAARLRAGVPAGWRAGDKTGTGDNAACNDVAILWPPARPPILIAAFLSGSTRTADDLNAAHADIARILVAALG